MLTAINGPATAGAQANQFVPPISLDPDLAQILAAYLSTRNSSLAGFDQNQSDLTTQLGLNRNNLQTAQEAATRRLNASLADRGIGQSGIALKAMNDLNTDYGDQFQGLENNYNNSLSDLATKRIAANQLYGQQEAGLWSQNTERASKAYQDQQTAAAQAAQAKAAQDAQTALIQQQLAPAPAVETPAIQSIQQPAPRAPAVRQVAPAPIKKPATQATPISVSTGPSIGSLFSSGLGKKPTASGGGAKRVS